MKAQNLGGTGKERHTMGVGRTSTLRSSNESAQQRNSNANPTKSKQSASKEDEEDFVLCDEHQRTGRKSFIMRKPKKVQRQAAGQGLDKGSGPGAETAAGRGNQAAMDELLGCNAAGSPSQGSPNRSHEEAHNTSQSPKGKREDTSFLKGNEGGSLSNSSISFLSRNGGKLLMTSVGSVK